MKLSRKWIAAGVAVIALGGTGAAMLAMRTPFVGGGSPKAAPSTADAARYVSLDKLVVMLRSAEAARPRYMSIDLVFTASDEKAEKRVREQLPLLRALSYQALSEKTVADVMRMKPADFSILLNKTYEPTFGSKDARPFADVLVAKVIVD
ncbi:flagellar basal body-associated FliL family protein [Burkholderia semiarida]|uniref:Flagellar protein FliL n=1 Tax=Burkholderia semiarida TaxID=2843303 RepID=A0ABW7L9K5_9BURK